MVSCAGQVGQAREHRIRVKMGLQLEKFIYHQHHRVDVGVSMSSSSSAELEGFDDTERLGFRIPTMSLSIPTYPPDQMLTDPVIISAPTHLFVADHRHHQEATHQSAPVGIRLSPSTVPQGRYHSQDHPSSSCAILYAYLRLLGHHLASALPVREL